QFVVSLFFITTSILIYHQFKHFIQFDYGFISRNIVNVELQGSDYRKLANELNTVPGVAAISATDIIPSTGRSNGIQLKKVKSLEEATEAHIINVDENFVNNLGLQLISGKNLPASGELSDRFIVVN